MFNRFLDFFTYMSLKHKYSVHIYIQLCSFDYFKGGYKKKYVQKYRLIKTNAVLKFHTHL